MDGSSVTLPSPLIPAEVREFAAERGLVCYLDPVIDVAQEAFASSALSVSLGEDAEDDTHQYIAIDVGVSGRSTDELLAGQRAWSEGVSRVCPPRHAVYFVLGWR